MEVAMRVQMLALGLLVACGGASEGGADAEKKSTCALSLDNLDGQSFVKGSQVGKNRQLDILARVRFEKQGDVLKAKYTVRSFTDVYTYTCKPEADGLTCWADEFEVANYCRSLWGNEKACTPEAVAELTGLTVDEVRPKVEETLANLNKLSGVAKHQARNAFGGAGIQLRGLLKVKLKEKECRLLISDLYQGMTNGQLREFENPVGTSDFFQNTERDLVFEHCADGTSLVAQADATQPAVAGAGLPEVAVNTPFHLGWAGDPAAQPGCTYSQKGYVGYLASGAETPVAAGADGKLAWGFDATVPTPGKTALHLVRYAACEGKEKAVLSTACTAINVQ
jgi:hypothetical protein